MKTIFIAWSILVIISLALIALTKEGKRFYRFDKPVWRMNFIEIMAISFVIYCLIPLTIPKALYMIFSNK